MLKTYAKHDRVILQPVDSGEQTVGQIVLSDNGKEKANQYKVISVGPGVFNPFTGQFTPTQYKVGDIVFIHKVHTHMIEVDGEEYFVARDSEILLGIEEENEDLADLISGIQNESTDELVAY